jgi:hypothetical protein
METNHSSASLETRKSGERDDGSWIKNVLYKIHLDLHTPDWDDEILKDIDPHQIISTVTRAGVDTLYFFSKDCYGNAYYNTKLGHKHRCIGDRDLLAEMLAEGRKAGVRIVAYHSIIWDNGAAEAHPEWCMRGPDGEALTDCVTTDTSKWKYLCHNTGYRDYLLGMIREVAENYDVAGFHLDMLNMDFGGLSCYCDICGKLFHEQTGQELPTAPSTDPIWRKFLEFRYKTVERLGFAMRDLVQGIRPGLPVIMNYHASFNFDWRVGQMPVRHSLYSSMGTGETYTPMLGDMYPGLESRYIRDLVPGRAAELASWRMNRITDFTIKPKAQLQYEMFISLACNVNSMLIDQTFANGWLDEVPYDVLAEVFKEIEAKRSSFGGEPVKQVALFYSCRSRDYYGMDRQEKFQLPVMGAYKAMVESHFNLEFLFDETLSPGRLAEFPVVLLPNVAALTAAECRMFTDYVAGGGVLIATLDTSLYSESGGRLPNFQLNRLFGVDYEMTSDFEEHYLRNLPAALSQDVDRRYHILNKGSYHIVRPTTAQAAGDLHAPFRKRKFPDRFFSHNMHPPDKRVTDALFINRHGKGVCIYMPHGLDASYADLYELPEHRKLLRNLVATYAPAFPVRVKAPLNVESIINRKDGRILVHLLAFSPIRAARCLPSLDKPIQPSNRMEEPCIYRAVIELDRPVRSAKAFHSSTILKIEANQVIIQCEQVHEVVDIA